LLTTLAKHKKRKLMVDYTYIYTPAIVKLKSIIGSGQLGDIVYIDCVRTNLGILQKDTNVIYDLAAHDFSIMDYLFHRSPKTITATGVTHKDLRQETAAYIGATYSGGMFAHFHVSWLSPVKIRRIIFVGTRKMVTYDDIEPSEKIKIYDKGVSFVKDPKQSYQLRIGYRSGSAVVPHVPLEEGLFGMAKEFAAAIEKNHPPVTDAKMGLRVVSCLEAATKSLRTHGKPVAV
jgi:predicted dehydrogenase